MTEKKKPWPPGAAVDPPIELDPDAWPRFEEFIKKVAKAGPRHRTTEKKSRPKGSEKA